MKLIITSGIGTGDTTLSAFDSALNDAGVYNYNLLRLSSVIPPKSEIVIEKFQAPESKFGDRLYVVSAEERSDLLGHSIAAGIGWYQWDDGRGVFAEHHDIVDVKDAKEAEANVSKKLIATIKNLCENREVEFDQSQMGICVSSTEISSKPSCALVIAVYKSFTW